MKMKITRMLSSVVLLLLFFAGLRQEINAIRCGINPAPPQHIIAHESACRRYAAGAGCRLRRCWASSYIDDSAEAVTSGRYHGIPGFSAKYPATGEN